MIKQKLQFCCQTCGTLHPKWTGQCTGCNAWNTIVEEKAAPQHSTRNAHYAGHKSSIQRMQDVTIDETLRVSSSLLELDRVLGGGIIMGSATLIGGDPGIGKSTILLQAVSALSQTMPVLYVTGEESPQQVTLRARRLSLQEKDLWLLADTNIEKILELAQKEKPQVLVIDSIQTMHTDLIVSAPGSVSQVRECAAQLVSFAKQTGTVLFLVGHVTKEGHLAGPRVLEHMVDTVLYFEGEQDSRYRMIRAVKNRFGAVNELGIFAMTENGLKEVSHPSAIFLSRYNTPVSGSIITATKEGSRPLLVEVQALVDQSHMANPRRLAVGLDIQRLSLLLGVLSRHTGISVHSLDVFLNVVGGLQINEPAADLASIFAILSSLRNKPVQQEVLAFGEVGLAGEIRPVPGGQERLREAEKHGFKTAIIPEANTYKSKEAKLKITPVNSIKEAILAFDALVE